MGAILVAALAAVAVGTYLRWACKPIAIAYEVGKAVQRRKQERSPRQPASDPG